MWLRLFILWSLLILVLAACGGQDTETPLSFTVDPLVTPNVSSVPGLNPGDPPRPTGAFMDSQGRQSDFVLNELMVTAPARNDLDPLLARWGATVVDEMVASSKGVVTYLVRIDPEQADPSSLASDLRALNPNYRGEQRLSSENALNLLAIAAAEAARHGASVSLNWLPQFDQIDMGITEEAPSGPTAYTDDAFQWPYMSEGSDQDIGVGAAWQLLEEAGRLDARVPIMIVDGGFNPNDDFPLIRTLYDASWGDPNPWTCSGGNPCPWHGTDVTMALMGRVDNSYGVAGPAGPVAELIAVQPTAGTWGAIEQMKEVAEEEKPRIINMSFSFSSTAISFVPFGPGFFSELDPRVVHFYDLIEAGIIMVASAGNSGVDVNAGDAFTYTLPCEIQVVICVGGMAWDATTTHNSSNYSSAPAGTGVELYAPYQVWSVSQPGNPGTNGVRLVGGTSFSSPFVAGVAALVLAADPSLTPDEVRRILGETAHQGGLGPRVSENGKRINALGAVSRALELPTIEIVEPNDGATYTAGTEITFEAEARDVDGSPLGVVWNLAGETVTTQPGPSGLNTLFYDELPPDEYTITATATGASGRQSETQITVIIEQPLLEVFIITPKTNDVLLSEQVLTLVGQALSDCCLLTDNDVQWRVKRGGSTVFTAFGQVAAAPAATMTPGSYEIILTGSDGYSLAERNISVVVRERPNDFPTASISSPETRASFGYSSPSAPPQISFSGGGSDPEDGALAGSRLRWTATHSGGTIVLCEGSAFGGGGAGSCSAFSAELEDLSNLATGTNYAIKLEVKDSDGNISYDEVGITVRYFVP